MIQGEILKRAKLNLSRLRDPLYSYPNVFEQTSDWPGDFPGRALLSLTSLYGVFEGNEQEDIKEHILSIISHLDEYLNEDRYFGQIINDKEISEQQLSGNSWYIRGLCRYYEISKDEKAINYLRTINEKLLIPLAKHYKDYPLKERIFAGGVSGHILNKIENNWLLSSDVGCAFILLDGYVSCYEILKDERLKHSIEFIIEQYQRVDFVALKCQTHATMTCARAILRFYQLTKEEKYLDLVKKMFALYVEYGMTDDYQNINWFQKEDSWTEACCIIDSFILCKYLYLITKEVQYLKLYNRIYLNSLRTFQRINGGAGCSSIVKGEQRILKASLYEAYFCCSMRMGEGLFELSKSFIDNQLLVADSYRNDDIDIEIDLYDKKVFKVHFLKPGSVSIYVPDGFTSNYLVKNNMITISSNEEKTINIDFELNINEDHHLYLCGDLILSQKDKHVGHIFDIKGQHYSYLNDSSLYEEDTLKDIKQVL